MKAPKITTTWIDNMAFEADVNGHKIIIDAEEEFGGKNRGPRPKPLLQVSLAGCTAMDVISILKKMQVNVDSFKVHVEGELNDEHPKYYKSLHIIYEFTGTNLPYDKLEKAVKLSQEKYCGVSATLSKSIPITYEIKIL